MASQYHVDPKTGTRLVRIDNDDRDPYLLPCNCGNPEPVSLPRKAIIVRCSKCNAAYQFESATRQTVE